MYYVFKKFRAELKLIWGIRYFNSGDAATAIKLSKKSLKIFPEYFEAFMFLGEIYESIDDYSKALRYYKSAIRLHNSNVIGYIAAINCLYKVKKYNSALNLSNEGIIHYKNDFNLLLSKIYIFEKMKEYDEAFKNINIAIELDDNHSYYYLKGLILSEMGKDSQSHQFYRKSVEMALDSLDSLDSNSSTNSYAFIGAFFDKLGEYDKAEEYFNKAGMDSRRIDDIYLKK